jgi:hypothetical protein
MEAYVGVYGKSASPPGFRKSLYSEEEMTRTNNVMPSQPMY